MQKDTSNPDWSQQIIFTELFPPLVRTMRIHVRDNNGTVIATTFLDLNVVADNSVEGILTLLEDVVHIGGYMRSVL